jgi:hypothetical protein
MPVAHCHSVMSYEAKGFWSLPVITKKKFCMEKWHNCHIKITLPCRARQQIDDIKKFQTKHSGMSSK